MIKKRLIEIKRYWKKNSIPIYPYHKDNSTTIPYKNDYFYHLLIIHFLYELSKINIISWQDVENITKKVVNTSPETISENEFLDLLTKKKYDVEKYVALGINPYDNYDNKLTNEQKIMFYNLSDKFQQVINELNNSKPIDYSRGLKSRFIKAIKKLSISSYTATKDERQMLLN